MDGYSRDGSIWEALADPARRAVLARLVVQDGARVMDLVAATGLSRTGTMRHLRVLEDAGVVRSERLGRERWYLLQTTPFHRVYEWLTPYLEAWAQGTGATWRAGATGEADRAYVLQTHIRCSATDLWSALTDPRMTERYLFGSRVMSAWIPESGIELRGVDGTLWVQGELLECEPLRLISMTWEVMGGYERGAPPSRVTVRIDEMRERCRLTLIHEDVHPRVYAQALEGWRLVLDSLKSLLETGMSLVELPQRRRVRRRITGRAAARIEAGWRAWWG